MFTVYFDYIVGFLSPDGQVGGAREPSSDRLHLGALLLLVLRLVELWLKLSTIFITNWQTE